MTQNPDITDQAKAPGIKPRRPVAMSTGPTNHHVKIAYKGGKPDFVEKDPIALYDQDTVTVTLNGFPAGSEIRGVDFFYNKVVGGQDRKDKGSSAGTWTRDKGPDGLTAYTVDAKSDTEVVITDDEIPEFDRRYWYGVRIKGPGNKEFKPDPELVNKSGTK